MYSVVLVKMIKLNLDFALHPLRATLSDECAWRLRLIARAFGCFLSARRRSDEEAGGRAGRAASEEKRLSRRLSLC